MGFLEHLHEKDVEPVLQPKEIIQSIRDESSTIDRLIHDSSTALETKVRLMNNKLNVVIESLILFIESAITEEEE